MSTTPAVLKLDQACEKLTVRVFNRDEELELTIASCRKTRAGTVPVFVVADSDG